MNRVNYFLENRQQQAIIIGSAVAATASYLVWKWWYDRSQRAKVENLIEIIEKSHEKGKLCTSQLKQERVKSIVEGELIIELRYIPILAVKDKLPTTKIIEQVQEKPIKDPFMPPFEEGKLICDLPPNHRLIFNKFYVCKNHLLIITKEFEDQKEPLNILDWKQIILIISALRGVVFFNCGQNAGFSQSHKHVQVLPEQAYQYPILKMLRRHIDENKMRKYENKNFYLCQNLDFLHGIYLLKEGSSPTQFLNGYQFLMNQMGEILEGKDFDYNLVTGKNFILIVPRRQEGILNNRIWLNSCVFLGFIMMKREEIYDSFGETYDSPSQVLREVTFRLPYPFYK